MLNMFAAMSQFEREIMLERQREGIAKAKAEGKYKGRKPTARAKAEDAVRLFREGKRVVITDPKQITDPLSEALAAVATEVRKLRERVCQLEGSEMAGEALPASLQRFVDDLDYQI